MVAARLRLRELPLDNQSMEIVQCALLAFVMFAAVQFLCAMPAATRGRSRWSCWCNAWRCREPGSRRAQPHVCHVSALVPWRSRRSVRAIGSPLAHLARR